MASPRHGRPPDDLGSDAVAMITELIDTFLSCTSSTDEALDKLDGLLNISVDANEKGMQDSGTPVASLTNSMDSRNSAGEDERTSASFSRDLPTSSFDNSCMEEERQDSERDASPRPCLKSATHLDTDSREDTISKDNEIQNSSTASNELIEFRRLLQYEDVQAEVGKMFGQFVTEMQNLRVASLLDSVEGADTLRRHMITNFPFLPTNQESGYVCLIHHGYLQDPVVFCTSCGTRYCKSCLMNYQHDHQGNLQLCRLCTAKLHSERAQADGDVIKRIETKPTFQGVAALSLKNKSCLSKTSQSAQNCESSVDQAKRAVDEAVKCSDQTVVNVGMYTNWECTKKLETNQVACSSMLRAEVQSVAQKKDALRALKRCAKDQVFEYEKCFQQHLEESEKYRELLVATAAESNWVPDHEQKSSRQGKHEDDRKQGATGKECLDGRHL